MAPPNLQPPVTDLDPNGTNGPERAIRSATDFLFFFGRMFRLFGTPSDRLNRFIGDEGSEAGS